MTIVPWTPLLWFCWSHVLPAKFHKSLMCLTLLIAPVANQDIKIQKQHESVRVMDDAYCSKHGKATYTTPFKLPK